MEYLKIEGEFPKLANCAVTMGKFDGIHRGHRKLVEKIKERKALGELLYDSVAQAAGISCTFIRNDEERCILSQAPTTAHKQDIRSILYDHFSSIPLYMDNVDSTQVPGNKSVLLLLNYFRMCWLSDSSIGDSPLHTSFYPVPDPLSYYVFGLRKIII